MKKVEFTLTADLWVPDSMVWGGNSYESAMLDSLNHVSDALREWAKTPDFAVENIRSGVYSPRGDRP